MSIPGVIKAIINQGTTCFPTPTVQIGAIIQILCGGNLNKLNKKDIGSHIRSSILALCSHHNLPRNNSNRIQVRRWILIKFLEILTSLTQGSQNQAKEVGELKNQISREIGELKNQLGEIVEFIGQIQEQSELSNSTIVNSTGDFEIAEAIILESGMEVGDEPKMSKPSQNMDEQLLFEENEDDKATAKEEPPLPQPTNAQPPLVQPILDPPPLPQLSKAPTPSNSGKVVPYSILSDPVPPNGPIPCRFMQSKEEEGHEGIFETFPKIQEKEVVEECLEFIKEDVLETTIPNEVGFYDTG